MGTVRVHACSGVETSSHKRGSGGRTDGSCGVELEHSHSFHGHAVEAGCRAGGMAVDVEVPVPHVVSVDDDNVGLFW